MVWYAFFGGCAFAASLDGAYACYYNGEYEETLEITKQMPGDEEALYLSGLVYLKQGEYGLAREVFGAVARKFPSSSRAMRARLKMADVFFLDGKYAMALEEYRAIERSSNAARFAPLLCLRYAQIAARQGRWTDKRAYIQQLKQKYPAAAEIVFADILARQGDFFTLQVGAFSERKNAVDVERELRASYPVYLEEDPQGKFTFYKVKVGKYKTRAEAERVNSRLLEEGFSARMYP